MIEISKFEKVSLKEIGFIWSNNEVGHITSSLKTTAITTPKIFIKGHKKSTRKGYFLTRLVIPEKKSRLTLNWLATRD